MKVRKVLLRVAAVACVAGASIACAPSDPDRTQVAESSAIPVEETPSAEPTPARQCDPNYSGCVPIASDVDCAGGSGNGPAYVSGPIEVIGDDIYDLDRDNDGTACE